ncbi:MAG TPA: heavy metal translocating P-type ATPase [Solirubrobacteraceae bacterium]|nr:heavy metal translocating P-type ATPase [Solirubrobacteraceae bacterium]
MTCGACAARVERSLNALEGVEAHVNYAAERATVVLDRDVSLRRLLDQVASAGYTAELLGADSQPGAAQLERRVRSLRRRLLLAATLFMPLCDASIFFSIYPSLRFDGWQWLMVGLAAPVVTWAAWPFYEAAIRSARHRATTMDTLVSLGILASTGWSLYSMFVLDAGAHSAALLGLAHRSGGGIYLDVPAGVTTFLLAGRYFEAWSKRRSGNALRALAALTAREVSVLDAAGGEQRRPIAELLVGDRFVVRPGETLAADGRVLAGRSAIDRSVMTGESQPVDVGPGETVLGGTVSLSGRLVVQASSVGAHTQLGQMMRLVERAQNEKAAVQRLADRISSVFVPAVLVIALGTLLAWRLSGNPDAVAFSAALSVLIIACPCALGLATPAALLVASWAGARLGIFFKGYRALEASRQVDVVVLDKTGTLTEGRMTLADCETVAGVEQRTLLRLAGAVERASEHPIAHAIAQVAEHWYGDLPGVESFRALPGIGARGIVEGQEVYVGRFGAGGAPVAGLPDRAGPLAAPAPELAARCAAWEASGRTVVMVCRERRVIGALALADAIRPSAAPAVRQLQGLGLRCLLVTGDNETTASAVAASLGIDGVIAAALPASKVEIIRRLQREGHRVAMVGDGVNDAPALAAADLGLAVGSGTDVAINAAELIIMRDDLCVVATAIGLARRTLGTIRGNLAWAFLYNVVALPLAALGLLDPLIAGGAMALSSSFVVWNSSRLRRAAPQPSSRPALLRTV